MVGGEGAITVASVLSEYALELALLGDAYMTSRYVPREFDKEEVMRIVESCGR